MKIFENKFLVKLIAGICVFLTLLNFSGVNKVYADGDDEVWGGVLITPITKLMTSMGDVIMEIMHHSIQSQGAALIKINGAEKWYEKVANLIFVVVMLVVAALVVTSIVGIGTAIGTAVSLISSGAATATFSVGLGTIVTGGVAGIWAGIAIREKMIPDDLYLPAFSMNLEEIFSNKIALFDVNFFNPTLFKRTVEVKEEVRTPVPNSKEGPWTLSDGTTYDTPWDLMCGASGYASAPGGSVNEWDVPGARFHEYYFKDNLGTDYYVKIKEEVNSDFAPSDYFVDNMDKVSYETKTEETDEQSVAATLRSSISTWYFILRNLALLVLMLLLIYIGIKIAMGSTAGEKAKYKERLMDWIVALCLLFVMHYIMVFAVNINEKIIELVDMTSNQNAAYIRLTDKQYSSAEEELGDFQNSGVAILYENGTVEDGQNLGGEHGALLWRTDLAGLFRIQSQLTEEGTSKWVGYSLCYVVLALFTLFFAFTYLKRVVYMAFLTIIAPLVAMTYPIDKITDGKAQAFDSWLKEYIFNLLIQPLHLLLYTILITSAYTLASKSPVYALVAIGFMMPAERLMRRFFGFEKAKTPGLLGGAAGAAIAMSGLQSILRRRPHERPKQQLNNKSAESNKVNFANKNNVDATSVMMGDVQGAPASKPTKTKQTQNNNGNINSGNNNIDVAHALQDNNDMDENEQAQYLKGVADAVHQDKPVDMSYYFQDDNEMFEDGEVETPDDSSGVDLPDNPQMGSQEDQPPITPITPIDTSIPVSNSNYTTKNGKKRHLGKAVGRLVLGTGKQSLGVGKQVLVGALTGIHPLKMAGRVAAGATAATAGLLIGTASGDPNKAFQYTTAGAMAGNAFAKSISGTRPVDTGALAEDVKTSYYGEEYREHEIGKKRKEFLKSQENINYLMQSLGVTRKKAKEILDTTGARCFDNNITDIKDVATIHKLTTNVNGTRKPEMTFEEAVAARSYAKVKLGGADTDSMDQEKVSSYKDKWAGEFQKTYAKKNPGKVLTSSQANNLADQAWERAIRFNKVASNVNKGAR